MTSPTIHTLKYLRKHGMKCQVVEQYVRTKTGGFRRDLFNCVDIVVLAGKDTIGVQATSYSNHSARVTKSLQVPELRLLLGAGWIFLVMSWRKNERINRWIPRAERITLENGVLLVSKFPLK